MDDILGTSVFKKGYSKSPVVFGAFPSMHCGWPFLLTLYYTGEYQKLSWGYSLLLAWAAMYLKHHYLTDVIAGWCYAFLAMRIANWGRVPDKASRKPAQSYKAVPTSPVGDAV